jgi:hypothetical protein
LVRDARNCIDALTWRGIRSKSGDLPKEELPMAQKKVRIRNLSDVDIRAFCLSFNPGVSFVMNIAQGAPAQTNTNVDPGHRAVVVYETFNEGVIATGDFVLEAAGKNVEVTVSGNTGSYTLSYALFD